jgi:hypothetical protein
MHVKLMLPALFLLFAPCPEKEIYSEEKDQ